MHLNHSETLPHNTRSVEKLPSTKLVLGAKKVGDRCLSYFTPAELGPSLFLEHMRTLLPQDAALYAPLPPNTANSMLKS